MDFVVAFSPPVCGGITDSGKGFLVPGVQQAAAAQDVTQAAALKKESHH